MSLQTPGHLASPYALNDAGAMYSTTKVGVLQPLRGEASLKASSMLERRSSLQVQALRSLLGLVCRPPPVAPVLRSLQELVRRTLPLAQLLRLRQQLVRGTPPPAQALRFRQELVWCSPSLAQALHSLQELARCTGTTLTTQSWEHHINGQLSCAIASENTCC